MNLLQFSSFLYAVLFFRTKGWTRIGVYTLSHIIFPFNMTATNWPVPLSPGVTLPLLYTLAHLYEMGIGRTITRLPNFSSVAFHVFTYFVTCQLDPRIALMNKFTRPVVVSLSMFVALPFLWRDAKQPLDPKKAGQFLLYITLGTFAYSILTRFTGNNPYHLYISTFSPAPDIANIYMGTNERFRISSVFGHPMDYGLFCAYGMLLGFQIFELKAVKKNILTIMVVLSGVGVGMANSRLPMLLWFVAISLTMLFARVWKSHIGIKAAIGVTLVTIGLSFGTNNIVGQALQIFNESEAVQGSSMSMRMTQLRASTNLALEKPFFGHGLSYITETMGLNVEEDTRYVEEDFAGFESILFAIPIESGYIGLLAIFIVYANMLIIGLRKINHLTWNYPALILFLFLFYQIGTGLLGTAPLSLIAFVVSTKLLNPNSIGNNHTV